MGGSKTAIVAGSGNGIARARRFAEGAYPVALLARDGPKMNEIAADSTER